MVALKVENLVSVLFALFSKFSNFTLNEIKSFETLKLLLKGCTMMTLTTFRLILTKDTI